MIVFLSDDRLSTNYYHQQRSYKQYYIYLYSILSDKLRPLTIEAETPPIILWSDSDSSLFYSTVILPVEEILPYRQSIRNTITAIYRVNIVHDRVISIVAINDLPLLIAEWLYIPLEKKIIFTSTSRITEDLNDFEIYSINLRNHSTLESSLTNNKAFEIQLQLSNDRQTIFYRNYTRQSNQPGFNDTQRRLYSLDLTDGHTERFGKDFQGTIFSYTIKSDGGVYILGQLGTEIQIYMQQSSKDKLIHLKGWNGTYERIATSLSRPRAIAFVYSSWEKAKEIYFISDIDQLQSAQAITHENNLFSEREIPKAKVYQWKNEEDNQTIEGILQYPPEKFQTNNLPLLVLMHGGPYDASLNDFQAGWYNWAPLAATQGWLVFEPNYCGSSGYGDDFLNEIRSQPLTRPTRDILSAIDQLIKDGIVDSTQLAVGGYSYGGFLTNWLITQTTRFNAALSGSGSVDHTSSWGTMDLPVLFHHLFGNMPWNLPHIYQTESPIYQLSKVRTPTLIVTGEKDVRVDPAQSYILERGLYYLGVPVQLIILPNEGHDLGNNPWHEKIKVREELKWLERYGHQPY